MLAMNSLARPTYCCTCFFSSTLILALLRCRSAESRVYIGFTRRTNLRLSTTSTSKSAGPREMTTSGMMYIARVSRSLELVDEKGQKYRAFGYRETVQIPGGMKMTVHFGPDTRTANPPKLGPPVKLVLNEWQTAAAMALGDHQRQLHRAELARVLRRFQQLALSPSQKREIIERLVPQVRVHLAAIDHPVVGDGTYGGDRNPLRPGRPFLHAHALALTHPTTGEHLAFTDPLPPELAAVLTALEH